MELEDELPDNEYREYFAPDYRLSIPLRADVENLNTREYLDQLKRKLFATLARCGCATHMHSHNLEAQPLIQSACWMTQRHSAAEQKQKRVECDSSSRKVV